VAAKGVSALGLGERLVGDTRQQSVMTNLLTPAPAASRQHFDRPGPLQSDQTAGQQSYFGAVPPQVLENL
jgi:hypothetical protein